MRAKRDDVHGGRSAKINAGGEQATVAKEVPVDNSQALSTREPASKKHFWTKPKTGKGHRDGYDGAALRQHIDIAALKRKDQDEL